MDSPKTTRKTREATFCREVITTNTILKEVMEKINQVLSVKSLRTDYTIQLEYRSNRLDKIDVTFSNYRADAELDAKAKFALVDSIRQVTRLAFETDAEWRHLVATYTVRGVEICLRIYLYF